VNTQGMKSIRKFIAWLYVTHSIGTN